MPDANKNGRWHRGHPEASGAETATKFDESPLLVLETDYADGERTFKINVDRHTKE
jgi:hypothetical protein